MPDSSIINPLRAKGALIEFSNRFIANIPNVIFFQYNPETMTRKLEAWYMGGADDATSGGKDPVNAQPHDPPETIDLVLEFDANDDLSDPVSQAIAAATGISARLAALELLLYPQSDDDQLFSSGAGQLGSASNGKPAPTKDIASKPVPRAKVPDLLFCWGKGRIVPVRIASFSIEEQAFSPMLMPIRAKVSLSMKIIQPRNLPCSKDTSTDLLKAVYKIYKKEKQGLALINLAGESAESVKSAINMIPT